MLDLKHWKKIKSDKHTTTFEHADGHSMTVAHSSLTPKLRSQLSKIPAYAEGGEVEPQATTLPEIDPNSMNARMQSAEQGSYRPEPVVPPTAEEKAYSTLQASATPIEFAAPAAIDPYMQGVSAGTESGMAGRSQELTGAESLGQAQQQGEAHIAAQQGQAAQESKAELDRVQAMHQQMEQERQKFQQAVLDTKIDPQRYMKDMGLFDKIRTGIGMIIAGVGGPTGAEAVYNHLQNKVDADIKAQYAEKESKMNLLHASIKAMGDRDQGEVLARSIINDHAMRLIDQAAAQSRSAQAMPTAQMLKGKIMQATAQMVSQSSQLDAMKKVPSGQQSDAAMQYMLYNDPKQAATLFQRQATSPDGAPEAMIPAADEKMRENMVKAPNGRYYLVAPKSAEEYKSFKMDVEPLEQSIKELSSLNTMGTRLSMRDRAAAQAALLRATDGLMALSKNHRISEVALGFERGQLSDPTAISTLLTGNAKNEEVLKSLARIKAAKLRTAIPQYKGLGR